MTELTVEDLENAALDTQTIADVANVTNSDLTTINRANVVINTLLGQLSLIGYIPPFEYIDGSTIVAFNLGDNLVTINRLGIVYAPLPSALPFTTTGTWVGVDEDKFFVVQISATNVENLNTLSGVDPSTENTLGLFSGDTIQDDQSNKGAMQDLETAVDDNIEDIGFLEADVADLETNVANLILLTGQPENSSDMGVFTGGILDDNEVLTFLLQQLSDAVEAVSTQVRGCFLRLTDDQEFTVGANTYETIIWTSEVNDTDALHDLSINPSRITVPAGFTRIKLTTNVNMVTTLNVINTGGIFMKNGIIDFIGNCPQGNNIDQASAPLETNSVIITTPWLEVVEGDYFEVQGYHTSNFTQNFQGGVVANACWVNAELGNSI